MQPCVFQWHCQLLQVSKGLSDISFKYELLESENSINGESLKSIRHDVSTGRFCVDLAQLMPVAYTGILFGVGGGGFNNFS